MKLITSVSIEDAIHWQLHDMSLYEVLIDWGWKMAVDEGMIYNEDADHYVVIETAFECFKLYLARAPRPDITIYGAEDAPHPVEIEIEKGMVIAVRHSAHVVVKIIDHDLQEESDV